MRSPLHRHGAAADDAENDGRLGREAPVLVAAERLHHQKVADAQRRCSGQGCGAAERARAESGDVAGRLRSSLASPQPVGKCLTPMALTPVLPFSPNRATPLADHNR